MKYKVKPTNFAKETLIDLSKANVGVTGDGGSDTPYSITAK